jgi:hypothetical protein
MYKELKYSAPTLIDPTYKYRLKTGKVIGLRDVWLIVPWHSFYSSSLSSIFTDRDRFSRSSLLHSEKSRCTANQKKMEIIIGRFKPAAYMILAKLWFG